MKLKNKTDMGTAEIRQLVIGQRMDFDIINDDFARIGTVKRAYQMQKCGLSRT